MYSEVVQRVVGQVERMEERGWRVCVQDMLKSGTVWKVISTIMPRAAEGEESGAEEGGVGGGAAGDELGVGEEDGEGCDGLGEEAMFQAGAMGAGADASGDGLNVDRAEVGKGEVVLGQCFVEVVQRDAAFEADKTGECRQR